IALRSPLRWRIEGLFLVETQLNAKLLVLPPFFANAHCQIALNWASPLGFEAEGRGDGAHGGDAGSDVVFDGNAELLGAARKVVAADATGEGFVLHLALHGIGFDFEDSLAGLDQRADRKSTRLNSSHVA